MRIVACLMFLLAWVGLGVMMGPDVWLWKQARAWSPGSATFVSVTPANQSPSGIVEVHYRYQARGALLESRRIFLTGRWWPPGSTLAALEVRFQTNLASRRPMRLWINPDDPADAVLYRNLNWSAMTPYWAGSAAFQLLALVLWVWAGRRSPVSPPLTSGTKETLVADPTIAPGSRATPPLPPRREAARQDTVPREAARAAPAAEPRISVLRAEGRWCVDLRFQARDGVGVDSVTLDRLDGQGILRWQDALRVNMLAVRPACYVRCPLPAEGSALEQARANPLDRWQVTFRIRTPDGPERWSESLPDEWWR